MADRPACARPGESSPKHPAWCVERPAPSSRAHPTARARRPHDREPLRAGPVGLIADTHGLLRPQALAALAGVRHIIHAGDVGRPEVLAALTELAPLTVVRGNVDHGEWAERLPTTAEIEIDGLRIHVLHIVDDLDLDPRAAGFGMVVYGHSHKPLVERRDGVLFVNPGSAGPRRFSLPVTVGLLHPDPAGPRVEIIELVL